MNTNIVWDDKKFFGLIGDKEVSVLATTKEPSKGGSDASLCVLFSYPGDDARIYALRWAVGAVLDLGTDDVEKAKGSVQVMVMLEGSDDE